MVIKKSLGVLFLVLFSLSLVSAWDVDITKLNDAAIQENYGVNVTSLSFTLTNLDCANVTAVIFTSDGGATNQTQGCSMSGGEIRIPSLLSEQSTNNWKVIVKANDASETSDSVSFWVDSIAPAVTFSSPLSSYTNQNFFEVAWNIIETNKYDYGLNQFSKIWIWQPEDGYPDFLEATAYAKLENGYYKHTTLEDLSQEGIYHYLVRVADKYSNGTKIRDVDFEGNIMRDVTNPVISITSPTAGANLTGAISITTTASDDRSGIGSINLTITKGAYVHSDLSCASESCSFSWDSTEATDGTATLIATVIDKAGNSDSDTITIEIDNTKPEIYFNSPSTGAYNSAQLVNITANDAHFQKIELYVNDVLAGTTTEKELDYSLGEGKDYSIYAIAYDTFGNTNQTSPRVITVDLTAPVITLTGANPQRIEYGDSYTELGAIALDNFDGNVNGNISIDASGLNMGFEGTYSVAYFASDSVGNIGNISRTVIVNDTIGPTMDINSPSPGDNTAYTLGTTLDFHVDDYDISSTAGCNLTINNAEYTMFQLESWDYNDFNATTAGKYVWNITCTDNSINRNRATSGTRSFTILSTLSNSADFSNSTSLTAQADISNVLNFFVENAFGKILWLEALDFSAGFDWSLLVSITENLIEVDSTTPELNKSAEITIYNISFANPDYIDIMRDGVKCSAPICNILIYNDTSKTLVFNVTGFTNYSAQQGAYCGDGTCGSGEDCSSCSTDCGACSTGGGGGGGGGTSTTCTSIWSCTDWSECNAGTQTRTCTDLSGSCASGTKPAETQTCTSIPATAGTGEETETTTETEGAGGGLFGGITGAVIGNRAVQAGIAIAFVVIIAAAALLINRKNNAQIKVQPAAAHTARAEEDEAEE